MIRINTVATLQEVHAALREVQETGDQDLLNAAESVLSALVVVIRREEASVPDSLRPHLAALARRGRK